MIEIKEYEESNDEIPIGRATRDIEKGELISITIIGCFAECEAIEFSDYGHFLFSGSRLYDYFDQKEELDSL